MPTYFRLHPEHEDPDELLDPEKQVSKPWGSDEEGKPCEKCGGDGKATFRCYSCSQQADPRCESCHGEVEFVGECPTCKGTGKVVDTTRRGVSVFADPDGLYRYMLRRDGDMEGSVIVELEGDESDDVDFDADEGALLVFPKKVVRTIDLDQARIRELRSEVEEEAA